MLEKYIELFHIAPLALIIASLVSASLYRIVSGKFVSPTGLSAFLLVLCSVGIASGSHIHHNEMIHIMDPCFAYAATLIGIAVHLVKSKIKVRA